MLVRYRLFVLSPANLVIQRTLRGKESGESERVDQGRVSHEVSWSLIEGQPSVTIASRIGARASKF